MDMFLSKERLGHSQTQRVFCVHCSTGHEKKTANLISLLYPDIIALAVIQENHRSMKGEKTITRQVMLPGYVFIYSVQPIPFRQILPLEHVISFLTYGDEEDLSLRGDDLAFALWVRQYDGVLVCSRAVSVGSDLRIIEGPLRDHIGTVEKIDRHNRNICLGIQFSGSLRKIWMPFQWAEKMESRKLSDAYKCDSAAI